jgi:hypothetical protein
MQTTTKRTTVNVDDRRAVLMATKFRKPRDVAAVPHEQFIRQFLKAKMGYAKADQAPQSIKDCAKQMANSLRVPAPTVVNTVTGEVK